MDPSQCRQGDKREGRLKHIQSDKLFSDTSALISMPPDTRRAVAPDLI